MLSKHVPDGSPTRDSKPASSDGTRGTRKRSRLESLLWTLARKDNSLRIRLIFLDLTEALATQYPQHAERLFLAYPLLTWRGRANADERVLRAHMNELLLRIVAGEPLQPATCAEVMMILCAGSAPIRLEHAACVLYEQLFQLIFGNEVFSGLSKPISEKHWPYRTQQIFAILRNGARDDSRRLRERTRRSSPHTGDQAGSVR